MPNVAESEATPSVLRLRVMGRLAVDLGEGWLDSWPRPAARRLVALLALTPTRSLGREVVADRLFGHLPADRALRNVSKALSQARSVVGPDVIEADNANLWFRDDLTVVPDLDETLVLLRETADTGPTADMWPPLRAALDRCDLLLIDDVYEEWAQEHLLLLSGPALEAALALARASGEAADWIRVTRRDSLSEEGWLALLADRAHRHDRQGVAQVIARCRSAYADYGLEPPADIVDAYSTARAPTATESRLVVGRRAEFSVLADTARAAAAGRGGSLVLSGAAGVGKSHLLLATSEMIAGEGHLVAAAASVVDDATVPFAALRSALSPLLAGRVTPGSLLSRVLGSTRDGETAETSGSIAALADELGSTLHGLDAPVLLVLDDIHWADIAMQSLLVRLAATIGARKWSLLMSARSDEPGHPVPPLPSQCRVLSLAPLNSDDATELARTLLIPGRTVDPAAAEAALGAIVVRSAGNPFFLTELVRDLTEGEGLSDPESGSVPDRVVALLRHRLAAASSDARRVVSIVALACEAASYDLLEAVLGTGGLRDAISDLHERHLLLDLEGTPRLIHPLLRDAAIAGTSGPERSDLHRCIAEALDALGSKTEAGEAPLLAANHRLAAYAAARQASLAGPAAAAGIAAGSRSLRMLAPMAAVDLLRQGLAAYEEAPPKERERLRDAAFNGWLDLGNALLGLGEIDDARTAYTRAEQAATTPEEQARCVRGFAWFHYREGRMVETEEVLRAGLESLPDEAEEARALLEMEIAWTLLRRGEPAVSLPVLERVATSFEDGGDWARAAVALDRLAMNYDALDQPSEALEAMGRALASDATGPAGKRRGVLLIHRAGLLSGSGRLDEALRDVTEGLRLLEGAHDEYLMSVAHSTAAHIHDRLGNVDAALTALDAEIALLDGIDNDRHASSAQAHRSLLLARVGRVGDSRRAADRARKHAARTGDQALIDHTERRLEEV